MSDTERKNAFILCEQLSTDILRLCIQTRLNKKTFIDCVNFSYKGKHDCFNEVNAMYPLRERPGLLSRIATEAKGLLGLNTKTQ